MQHLLVCLQGTFGDHSGGINKDNKKKNKILYILLVFLPLYTCTLENQAM